MATTPSHISVDDKPSGRTKRRQSGSVPDYLWCQPSLLQGCVEFEQFSRQTIESLGNEGLWRGGEVEIDAQQAADTDEGDDEDGAGNEALGQDDGVRLEIGAIRVFVGFPRLASSFLDNGSGGALGQF